MLVCPLQVWSVYFAFEVLFVLEVWGFFSLTFSLWAGALIAAYFLKYPVQVAYLEWSRFNNWGI